MAKDLIQKNMWGKLTKAALSRSEDGKILVRGYFTSDNKDMAGDLITRDATERALPAYREWGNIRLLHKAEPVGKITKIGVADGLEWNECEIKVIDPKAIFMVEEELVTALSVGILANFDDIDFSEDGGLIINDYILAEISLVDHPANYDAKLKDAGVVLDESARSMALQYGLDAVVTNKLGGKEMSRKVKQDEVTLAKDASETEEELELSEEAQEVTPEEVVEEEAKELPSEEEPSEEVSEEQPVADSDAEDKSIDEEAIEEEEEIVEESADEPSEEIEASIETETETLEEDIVSSSDTELKQIVVDLKETFEDFVKAISETRKGSEEGQETEEDADLQKQLEAIEAQNKELQARIEELENSAPAERKGLVADTNVEDLEKELDEQKDTAAEDEKVSLSKALKSKFKIE